MNSLQRFEHKLEEMISSAFARAFRSAVQPVEIAAALQRECDNNAQILSRDRRLVPNTFHVELAASDLERLQGYDDAMGRDLIDQLKDHADAQGYVFTGPVTVDFEAAEDLTTGRFRIRSKAEAQVTGSGAAAGDDRHSRSASRAVLEVNGSRHVLRAPGLVVGRGTEADLRINDPGVSRQHVEFVVTGDDVEVVDLGSTNGMLVNGTKVPRATLRDGSQVKIGRTIMTVHLGDSETPDDGRS
ncbi:FhaA domain-containing protein [Nocardioides piscis]|uniref:DUF3662 domain-containing protein n=1 Tax=Nocardioides piscis TaxID=2714938 RepID=A0A6G7YDB6_9ACTN|nr:DUF3662 and FHA domain-containing protein [Nocardioides piscis]QIK74894.1 DUF3662 domain-containing protein [Nocardioides piscis]